VKSPYFRAMQGKNEDMTNEQSAKKQRMSVAVKEELLSLRHRFGERTSCEGRLTTQFRLVNSGKILSRDERRQMSTPYCYRAWTAFPHFLIRFTRAIQRNEKGWDALFCYALPVAPLRVFARNEAI
jgi:hypothetical protein